MLDCGVNAILIKVAGIGLKPHHLGQSLAQMQPVLQNLVRRAILWDPRSEYLHPLLQHTRFGSHICGEGGEYETLTLDCPAFKKRIVL
jgi:diphthine-ammonia ligase